MCIRDREYGVPIRVGVNSGSLEKPLIEKYGGVTAEGIVESALEKVGMIERLSYDNLVISIKSSDVMMCIKAHELIAKKTRYPLQMCIRDRCGAAIFALYKTFIPERSENRLSYGRGERGFYA